MVGNRHGYFLPAYLGSEGWVGIELTPSTEPDWDEVPSLIEQAWRMTASKAAIADWENTPTRRQRSR